MSATLANPPAAAQALAPFSVAVQLVRDARELERQRQYLLQQAQARLQLEIQRLDGSPELQAALVAEYVAAAFGDKEGTQS